MGKIIFIGGIHGVGKGTICKKLAQQVGIEHLSASEVLKWSEVKDDVTDKRVDDIPNTQDRLVSGLKEMTNANDWYLLDGHYCLFDKENEVSRVPMETFQSISPVLISIVVGEPRVIVEQLAGRDGQKYSVAKLEEMQREEIDYANVISSSLHVPLLEVRNGDTKDLLNSVNRLIHASTT